MRNVELKRFDGGTDEFVCFQSNEYFHLQELDINDFRSKKRRDRETKLFYNETIYNYFLTFDIESHTVIPPIFDKYEKLRRDHNKPIPKDIPRPWAYMYHWQAKIDDLIFYGHYWDEVYQFFEYISKRLQLNKHRRLICFIHNLGYESWWMLRDFFNRYTYCDVFAVQPKKPLKIFIEQLGIEFRCSMRLSNMSLEKAVQNEKGTLHPKAAGDLDYKALHLPSKELKDQEFGYAIGDVVSLYEYIENKLKNENDDFFSIPLTSTGYIRRIMRRNCLASKDYRRIFYNTKIQADVLMMLYDAARGGDTHANRELAGKILHFLDSFDAVSEYPYVIVTKPYPMTAFQYYGEIHSMAELEYCINTYACLFTCVFTGLRVKDNVPSPYISFSKSDSERLGHCGNFRFDNGRVLSNEDGAIALTITDIDYKIIRDQYEWDEIAIANFHIAEYGYLPDEIIDTVMQLFKEKCELSIQIDKLERIEQPTKEQEAELENLKYLYGKKKNLLNGIFGCFYTKPVHAEISIDPETLEYKEAEMTYEEVKEKLDEYYKSYNSFLNYAWGVWTTCHGRAHLNRLIKCTSKINKEHPELSNRHVYGDTDSSKAIINDYSPIEALNDEIRVECERRGAFVDVEGKRFYMGIFERETDEIHGQYEEFCTLGAKKYCYRDKKGLHTTIAGVNKKKAPKELGTIENFKPGFIFEDAGGNTIFYHSHDYEEHIYKREKIMVGNNVAITDSTYRLGYTLDYGVLLADYEVDEEFE